MARFKVGSKVRLKHPGRKGARTVATIVRFYSDIKGGVVLDKQVNGFYSWNVQDLVPAKPREKR